MKTSVKKDTPKTKPTAKEEQAIALAKDPGKLKLNMER